MPTVRPQVRQSCCCDAPGNASASAAAVEQRPGTSYAAYGAMPENLEEAVLEESELNDGFAGGGGISLMPPALPLRQPSLKCLGSLTIERRRTEKALGIAP